MGKSGKQDSDIPSPNLHRIIHFLRRNTVHIYTEFLNIKIYFFAAVE